MKKIIPIILFILILSACSQNSETMSTAIVEPEASQVSQVTYDATAIHKAAHTGDIDLVKKILETAPDLDARDSFGGTPLHAAMFQDNMEIITLLIEYGYDINAQGTSNGFTPLHDAVWASNVPAIKLLLDAGADKSIKNKDGQTPEDKAKDNNEEIYHLLITPVQ